MANHHTLSNVLTSHTLHLPFMLLKRARDRQFGQVRAFLRLHWPLIGVLMILGIATGQMLLSGLAKDAGYFTYPFDDAYIHMAMARHFVQQRVWGITPYEFSSSTSSPLWTFTLSLFYLAVGPNEWVPLFLTVLLALFVTATIYFILRRQVDSGPYVYLALLIITFATPLPLLILSGMDHLLHLALTLLVLHGAAQSLAESAQRPSSRTWVALVPLLGIARYEGLFLVGLIVALSFLRGRRLQALLVFSAGVIPVAVYGLISFANGWYFLPNSVIFKGPSPLDLQNGLALSRGLWHLLSVPALLALVVASLLLYLARRRRGFWEYRQILLLLFLGSALLNYQFAFVYSFFRYEAYLVAVGGLAVAVALADWLGSLPNRESFRRYLVFSALAPVLFLPLGSRATTSASQVAQAMTNIYEQQYQMGLFVRRYYDGQAIAANDIGAINFLANVRCFDVTGLGTRVVANARRDQTFDTERLSSLAEASQVRLAVVYDRWLSAGMARGLNIPPKWILVGQWQIENKVVVAEDTVSFYALNPADALLLVEQLREFASAMPPTVHVTIGEIFSAGQSADTHSD